MPRKDIREEFRRLKPVLGSNVDALWLNYLMGDESEKREIIELLPVLTKQKLNDTYQEQKVILPPPSKAQADGEYYIGDIQYADKRQYPFCMREKDWIQHVAIFGRSGSGKTNLVFWIIKDLIQKEKPFWIIDWKRNYRDLLDKEYGKQIKIFTIGRELSPFRFNPLIPPPGTHPQVWITKLSEILAHAFFLGEGVIYLLHKLFDEVYREYGVYEETQTQYPTFKDVLKKLEAMKLTGRQGLWWASTLRTVFSLCFGEMGNVYCTQQAPLHDLLDDNIVFELDAITSTDKIFFIEALLLWTYHHRISEGERETFKHAIILEEAHQVLLKRKQDIKGTETVMDVIMREIREFGESLIIVDQHPSLISPTAIGNTFCSITFNLKHRDDVNLMTDVLILDDKQFFNRLPIGMAIVKMQGRYFDPFLVKVPLFSIKKAAVTDSQVQKHMASFTLFKAKRADKILNSVNSEPGKYGRREIELLRDIIKYPSSGINSRYKRLKMNDREGVEVQRELASKGIISPVVIHNRKGRLKLFDITKKGYKALKELGIPHNQSYRKGGVEHIYWINRIAWHYRKLGHNTEIEKPIGEGKSIDIVINNSIAVEIETGRSDWKGNVEKCLKKGFKWVVLVATSREVYQDMKREFGDRTGPQRVRIEYCKDVLKKADDLATYT